ncbi:ATP-binding cassette domain-containing protein [Rhodobacterales bacterium HKCCE2091]|nr:ATP-binding cassette domain-containing protein [Rhodobacterales bacterium HKCCE2091]
MTELVLENVGKTFGGVVASENVNIRVPAGRITGLIGPNGAGKTTIVNMITGMLALSSGRITFGDTDLTTMMPHRIAEAGLARTFQNIRLLKDASILENVMIGFHMAERSTLLSALFRLPGAAKETRDTRAAAMALLDRFGMTHLRDHPAGSLSYGHQRRVEMMRALAADPQLLLLDEPVAGMNEAESAELARIFRELTDEGRAILLIEHDMRFVTDLCHHVYVLDGGKVISEGRPADVLADPVVVTAYLGESIDAA